MRCMVDSDRVTVTRLYPTSLSFHVTPHKEWFSTYDASCKGKVCLGNDYACDIFGVGDV